MKESFPKDRVTQLLARQDVQWADVVYCAEVGSTAHGISTNETGDDLDLTVIRMESFSELIHGSIRRQSMMIRTQPDGVRSRMGDIDLQVYTLRKFVSLACGGNPSILGAIFSQAQHKTRLSFDPIVGKLASRQAGSAFLGYMRQQIERWQGVRGQKNVNRPELVEAYGFDTKYAAHVIRLGYQGIEYMLSGRFTMPMPEPMATDIKRLRTGEWSEEQAMEWATKVEDELLSLMDRSPLPEKPNVRGVTDWLADQYAVNYEVGRR